MRLGQHVWYHSAWLGWVRATVSEMTNGQVTAVDPHGAYARLIVTLSDQNSVQLELPDTVVSDLLLT